MNHARALMILAGLAASLAVATSTTPAVAPGATAALRSVASTPAPEVVASSAKAASLSEARDTARATEVLDDLSNKYRHLEGVTVSMGATPRGEEAVAYYTEGEIVIDTAHTVSIEKILAHEVWHVIDWRDNKRIDWSEDLPPRNSSEYLK